MAKTQKKAVKNAKKRVAKKPSKPSAIKAPAKKAAARKPAVKKAVSRPAAKPDGRLTRVAVSTGRTLGRAARVFTRRSKAPAKPDTDPEVAAERARTRAMWKSQADTANAAELAKHGALVDERARVRSNIGMSWANRKPR